MRDEITKVPDDEVDGDEGWIRETDEPELLNVEAYRFDDGWQVTVWVAEFLREDPLEAEFRAAMDDKLRAVPGVTDVQEEDREVWAVDGQPSGDALLRAAAAVVDGLADRARPYVDGESR
jgi:hypothetical protein